jgi:hypothetical protein
MSDVVVTVPKRLWAEWLEEGDLAYADDSMHAAGWAGDFEYGFVIGARPVPRIEPGERVYIVAHGHVRGYAPLSHIEPSAVRFGGGPGRWALVRRGAAVACTIPEPVRGFQGWRYRWWKRADELPFPDWRTLGVTP